MSYPRGTVSRAFEIPWSHAGIEATVGHMRRLARAAAADPLLRETAAHIVQGESSDVGRAQAIRSFLSDHVRFQPDPSGVELIRSPRLLLEQIADRGARGDCDDVATLGAALGMAVGIPARFKLLGFTPAGPFEHVYTELLTSQGPVELDTTRPAQMPAGLVIRRTATREA